MLTSLAFSASLAAQQLAPLPARLAEALHGQDATSRVPSAQPQLRHAGGKAPGSIAPSPTGTTRAILFSENFNTCGDNPPVPPETSPPAPYPAPPRFTVHNVDGLPPAANVAYINAAWIVREDFQTDVSDCVMFSTSWYSPAGAANDWAAFPTVEAGKITPTTDTVLRWNAKAYDPLYRDGYEVRYSTAGTEPADFLANPPLYSTTGEEAGWTARTQSLAPLAGTPIHLAFRNNSSDQFILVIDDIVVEDIVNFDPKLTAVNNTADSNTYGLVPAWLGLPYSVSADVTSAGLQTITGVTVDADALVDAALADSGTSTPIASIAAGATATVPVLSGVFDTIGRWTVEASVDATEGDQEPGNSSLEAFLVHVSADEISRADPDAPITGVLGIGADNGGDLGNDFVIDTEARLVAIRYTINNRDIYPDNPDPTPDGDGVGDWNGVTLQAHLWDWDTGTDQPGALLHTADVTIPIDAAAGPLPLEFVLPPGTILPPGRYLASAVEPMLEPPLVSTLPLLQAGNRFTPGTSWVDWPTSPLAGWANVEDFGAGFARHFVVSAVLVPLVHAPVAVDDAFTTDEDSVLEAEVSANDTLSDDGGNTWSQVSGPTNGTLALNPDGSFTYTPDADFNGNDSFTYSVCDTDNDCDEATVAIVVNPVNESPAAADDAFSIRAGETLADSVATNDTPSPRGANVWSVTVPPASGTLLLEDDGSFTFTSATVGNVSFDYSVCDEDGEGDCATATATIDVTAPPEPNIFADSFESQ